MKRITQANTQDNEEGFAEVGPDGVEEKSVQRFSLKLEDMPSSTFSRSADGWFNSFRRSRSQPQQARTPLQKSYSQYNLSHLGNTVMDDSHRQTWHGIYGLLARHIEVPPNVWEELQSRGKGAEQSSNRVSGHDARRGALRRPKRRPSIFGLPLLHPYSRLAVAWRCAMLLFDLSFTAFWVPLNVGFCFGSYGDLHRSCTRSDLVGGIVYVINWIVGFQLGIVATCGPRRMVVWDGLSVARVYILYGKFVIDTLASVPFFVLVSAISSPGGTVATGHRLWSLLSLMRLGRLVRLFNTMKVVYKDSLNDSYQVSWVAQRISVPLMFLFVLGYQFLVVINLSASLMILLATYYGQRGLNTWFDGLKWVDFDNVSPPLLWFHAAYWVITVLTTTGQGQAPRHLGEQIVSNFCSVYGMVFSGLVVGVVGEALMRASGDASALLRSRRNVARATAWAAMRHLRPSLTKDLQVFFADSELAHRDVHLARRAFNKEASYIEDLPTSLRHVVVQTIVTPLLEKVHIFSRTDPEHRKLLASAFRPVDVPPNHDLCRQGTTADRLWVVEWGTVVAMRHKEAEAHPTTGMVCLLGETILLRGVMEPAAMRPWTFRTTSFCRLWELHWADLQRLLRVEPSLVATMLQDVKERLIFKLDRVPERDYKWCELVVVLGRTLKQPAMLDCAQDNLEALVQARVDNGSLPLLLSSWLEAGIATSLELGLGANGGRKRGLVTMSLMLARQSNDLGASASSSNPYGASFYYSLAAPSPAIISRYGGVRGGGGGAPGSAAAALLGSGGGTGTASTRGALSGAGSGVPGSPLSVVPSASPAVLYQQTSGGIGDIVVGGALHSPGRSGEVPSGWRGATDGGGGGGGGRGEARKVYRGRSRPQAIAKRSRSFTYGARDGGGSGSAATTFAGAAATAGAPTVAGAAATVSAQSQTRSQTQSQLMMMGHGTTLSSGGGGVTYRAAPSLSRFAAAVPGRRSPWVEALATAATAIRLRTRHDSPRASLSDNGIEAADREGYGKEWVAVREASRHGADATPEMTQQGAAAEVESSRRSFIAHTTFAYAVVDAGGVPVTSHPHQHQHQQDQDQVQVQGRQQRQQHLIQQLQQQHSHSLPSGSGLRSGLAGSGVLGSVLSGSLAPAVSATPPLDPASASPQLSPRGSQVNPITATASVAAATSPASAFLIHAGSGRSGGGGGSPKAGIHGFGSPRSCPAGDVSPMAGSAGSGGGGGGGGGSSGGGSPFQGSTSGSATRLSTRLSLVRTRSAHMLPLVPEEEGLMRSSSDGGTGSGGGASSSTGGVAGDATSHCTSVRLARGNERASAPHMTIGLRRAVTISGFCRARPNISSGGAAYGVTSALVRHRTVPRSLSAFTLRPRPSTLPTVSRSPPLRRVRENRTASAGGGRGPRRTHGAASSPKRPSAAGDSAVSAAFSPELATTAICPLAERQLCMPPGGRVSPLKEEPPDGALSSTEADGLLLPPPPQPLYHRISAASSLPAPQPTSSSTITTTTTTAPGVTAPTAPWMAAAAGAGAASQACGEVSDRLLKIPLPDRVSRLRTRTGIESPVGFGPLPKDSGDAGALAPALGPRPHSPSAAAAVAAAAAAATTAGVTGYSGGSGGGGGACPAPTWCSTCGKCTCAACRARAIATALAVEQGTATVAPAARTLPLPHSPRPWDLGLAAAAAGSAAMQGASTDASHPALDFVRGTAGPTLAAGAVYNPDGVAGRVRGSAMPSWAHDAGAIAGRGPETWRRRRMSMAMDLSMLSVPLAR